jgi:hypothetical protein
MQVELYSKLQNPIEAIEKIGTFFAKSGMFGCEKIEQGMVLAMACMFEESSPLAIKRKYHLQNGELSMRADAMLADFRSLKGGKHKIVERSEKRAAVELTIDGQTEAFSFTWEDALKEPFIYAKDGKIKKNYATPRTRMQLLWARVVSDGVRAMAPEICAGTYTPEEIEDFDSQQPAKEFLKSEKPASTKEARAEAKINPEPPPVAMPEPSKESKPSPVDAEIVRETVNKAEIDPSTKKLTMATVQTLETLIGEKNGQKAIEFLKAKGKLEKTLFDVPLDWAQRIIDAPAKFIEAIGGEK